MYAHRRVYVKQCEHEKPEERYTVRVERGGKPVAGIQSERISSVDEEVMYWRKANHIHGWFVDNVLEGDDDCRDTEVSREQIRELLRVCRTVIANSRLVRGMVVKCEKLEDGVWVKHRSPGNVIENSTVAHKLLPVRKGFFFGREEYDEHYLYEVERTRDWAFRMLADFDNWVPGDIIYSSSS